MKFLLLAFLLAAAVPVSAQAKTSAGADTQGVYELSAVTVKPRPLNVAELQATLEATYPAPLRAVMAGGVVEVRFRVDSRGMPHDPAIIRTTHDLFNEPTLNAVRILRFAPAEVDDKPVAVWVVLPIHWSVAPPDPIPLPSR